MPVYDYLCLSCRKPFNIQEPIAAHGAKKVKCPACGKTRVERVFQSFFANTSRKS